MEKKLHQLLKRWHVSAQSNASALNQDIFNVWCTRRPCIVSRRNSFSSMKYFLMKHICTCASYLNALSFLNPWTNFAPCLYARRMCLVLSKGNLGGKKAHADTHINLTMQHLLSLSVPCLYQSTNHSWFSTTVFRMCNCD